MRIKTDATNDYLNRRWSPGTVICERHNDLEFRKPRLKDGILTIEVRHTSKEEEDLADIQITMEDERNVFELTIAVGIVPPITEEQVKIPKPEIVRREEWDNGTPPWDIDTVARIESWNKLKTRINVDSRPFDELKRKRVPAQKAEELALIRQIYMSSILLFLELKDLELGDDGEGDADQKGKIFEKAIRVASKMAILNRKK